MLSSGFGEFDSRAVGSDINTLLFAILKLISCKLNFSTFGFSYKVVDSESFNLEFLGLWASEQVSEYLDSTDIDP